ncbi:hypothetical protein RI367_003076 [Sorochytrium milnesiophthora]
MTAPSAASARLVAIETEIRQARLAGDAAQFPALIKRWRKALEKDRDLARSSLEHALLAEQAIQTLTLDSAATHISEAYATLLRNKTLVLPSWNNSTSVDGGLPVPPASAEDMEMLRKELANSQLYFEIVVMKAEVLFLRKQYAACLRVLLHEVDVPHAERPMLNSLGVVYLTKAIVMKAVCMLYTKADSTADKSNNLACATAARRGEAGTCLRYLLHLFPQVAAPELRFPDMVSDVPQLPNVNRQFPFTLPLADETLNSTMFAQYIELGAYFAATLWMQAWFDQVTVLQSASADVRPTADAHFPLSLPFQALTHQTLQFIRVYFVFGNMRRTWQPSQSTQRVEHHRRRITVAQWGIRFLVVWLKLILEADTETLQEGFFAPYYPLNSEDASKPGGVHASTASVGGSSKSSDAARATSPSNAGVAKDLPTVKGVGYEAKSVHEEIDQLFDKWVCSVVEVVPFPDALVIGVPPKALESDAAATDGVTATDAAAGVATVAAAAEPAVKTSAADTVPNEATRQHYRAVLSLYKPFYGNKLMEEFCDCLMWYDSLLMVTPSASGWSESGPASASNGVMGGVIDHVRMKRTLEILNFATRHTFHSLRILRQLFTAYHRINNLSDAITFFTRYVGLARERIKSAPTIAHVWFPPNLISDTEFEVVFPTADAKGAIDPTPATVAFAFQFKARASLQQAFGGIDLPHVARFTGFVEQEDGLDELLDVLVLGSQLHVTETRDTGAAAKLADEAHKLLDTALSAAGNQAAHPAAMIGFGGHPTMPAVVCRNQAAVHSVLALESHDPAVRQKQQRMAIKLLQQSLEIDPHSWEANKIKQALKYNRAHVASWHLLALLLTAQKDSDAALKISEVGLRECIKHYLSSSGGAAQLTGREATASGVAGIAPDTLHTTASMVLPDDRAAGHDDHRHNTIDQLVMAATDAVASTSISTSPSPPPGTSPGSAAATARPRVLSPREYEEFMCQLFDLKYTQALILEELKGPDAALAVCQELFRWFKRCFDSDFSAPELNGVGSGGHTTQSSMGAVNGGASTAARHATGGPALSVDNYGMSADALARLRSSSVKSSLSSWSVNTMSPTPQTLAPLSTVKAKKTGKRRSKLSQNMWSADADVVITNAAGGSMSSATGAALIADGQQQQPAAVNGERAATGAAVNWDGAVVEQRKSVDSTLTFGDVAALNSLSQGPYTRVRNLSTHSVTGSISSVDSTPTPQSFLSSKKRTDLLVQLWLRSAQVSMRKSQFEDARKSLYEAEKADPLNADVWAEMASFHFRTGNVDKAIQLWNRCLTFEPFHLSAQLGLGRAHLDCGNTVAAELILDDAVKRNGSMNVEAWYLYGKVHKASGNAARARECLQFALQLEKVSPVQGYRVLPRFWPAF